jgi:hypothetical protein
MHDRTFANVAVTNTNFLRNDELIVMNSSVITVVRMRRLAGNGFWGGLLDCFYCLSLWIASPFAWFLGERGEERFLLWLAFSTGAILLERITGADHTTPAPYWKEEDDKEEDSDGMLRTESPSTESSRRARH